MYAVLAQLARLLPRANKAPDQDVALQLMEDAEARAGQDPQQAKELRAAAYAFLRVVR